MEREKLLGFIDKRHVDVLLQEAEVAIGAFLNFFAEALVRETLEDPLQVNISPAGDQVFSTRFGCHVIEIKPVLAHPGRPFGSSLQFFIDGVEIGSGMAYEAQKKIQDYLVKKYSDEVALERAKTLRALGQRLTGR